MGQNFSRESGASQSKFQETKSNLKMSEKPATNISRFPVPEFSTLPEDLQKRLKGYALENGDIVNVFSALSYKPDELKVFLDYYEVVMANKGSLTTTDKEMIVLAVSSLNRCRCCVVIHGAFHRICAKNPILTDQISANWETAELNDRQRAILEFAMDMCQCRTITDEKIASLEKYGLTKDDAWEIGSVVAFFSLANRMANLLNIQPNLELYFAGRNPEATNHEDKQ